MPENAFSATLWGGLSYKGIIPVPDVNARPLDGGRRSHALANMRAYVGMHGMETRQDGI